MTSSPRARAVDQVEQYRRGTESHAGHVHDVQRRAGRRRVGNYFLQASHATGVVERSCRAKMHEHRRVVTSRDAERAHDLFAGCRRRIVDAHTDAQRALVERRLEPTLQLRETRVLDGRSDERASGADDIRAFGRRVAIEHRSARAGMARRHAEVDQRLAFSLGIPRRDGIHAQLQFERGRHAVARQVPVVGRILTVRVEIDKAWRHDESSDVDGVTRLGYGRGHGNDAPTCDPHGAHGVEVGLRVEHSATHEYDVDARRALCRGAVQRQ